MTEPSILVGATAAELDRFVHGGSLFGRDEHATAAAWVFDLEMQHLLLVRHRLLGWSCPGGHLEQHEALPAAAQRELREETGIVGTIESPAPLVVTMSIGCARQPGARHWTFGYRIDVDRHSQLRAEPDQPARWWPFDGLPSPHPADIDVVIHRLRQPTCD